MDYVFVSHASADKPRVKPIIEALAREGVKLWVDRPGYGENHFNFDQDFIERHQIQGLRTGLPWDDQIADALRNAGAILICISRSLCAERQVLVQELFVGKFQGKLAACIVDDIPYEEIPADLGLVNVSRLQAARIDGKTLQRAVRCLDKGVQPDRLPGMPKRHWEIFRGLVGDLNRILRKPAGGRAAPIRSRILFQNSGVLRETQIEKTNALFRVPGLKGDLPLGCELLPPKLLDYIEQPPGFMQFDETESQISAELNQDPAALISPKDIVTSLRELDKAVQGKPITPQLACDIADIRNVLQAGTRDYFRVSSIRCWSNKEGRPRNFLRVDLVKAKFNTWQLRTWRQLPAELPRPEFVDRIQPNLLAVKSGVVRQVGSDLYLVFQKRGADNHKFRGAWDLGAAGYVDSQKHMPDGSPGQEISLVETARCEIAEELQLDLSLIPSAESFNFFGITRVQELGSLDAIGYCVIDDDVFRERGKFKPNRKVEAVREDIRLNPKSLVQFIMLDATAAGADGGEERPYIVPSAVLLAFLILRTVGNFAWKDIAREAESLTQGRLELDPNFGGSAR